MAGGWSKDGAVQEQIDATIADGVEQARNRLPKGKSLTHCEECEEAIPEMRQKAIPGVRLCVECQSEVEQEQSVSELFNRSGSKDSQLK